MQYVIKNISQSVGTLVIDNVPLAQGQERLITVITTSVQSALNAGLISIRQYAEPSSGTMTRQQIIDLLGFEPYSAANPMHFNTGSVQGITVMDENGFVAEVDNETTWPVVHLHMQVANNLQDGSLSHDDWNLFNGKQNALGFSPYPASNPLNFISANQSINFSGDVVGNGTTEVILTLPNIITAGTATKIVYNAKGQIVGVQTLLASDIPNLSWSKITSGKPTTLSGYGITDAQAINANLTTISNLPTNQVGLLKITNGVASFDSTTYLTSNQSITISGDVSGTGTTNISVVLPNIISAGTATKLTYNAKGQIVGAENISAADIPNLDWSKITTGKPTNLSGYGITDAQPLNTNLTNLSGIPNNVTGLVKITNGVISTDSTNYLTGNQTISITGDASGSGSTSITLTLNNIVVAGSGTKINYNEKGLVTGSSSLIESDIPSLNWNKIGAGKPTTLTGYGIVDAQSLDATLTSLSSVSKITTGLVKLTNGVASLDATSYLTGNQNINITGDVSGSGTTNITLTLPNLVTGGTGVKLTYNNKGLITGSTTLAASDIPSLDWSKISTGKPTTLSGYGISDAQPIDADLTAIAALTNNFGLLRKTANDTWSIDTNTYYKSGDAINVTLTGIINGSNAAAGIVGEYLEASVTSAAPISLVTATVSNLLSITLTAGDWDVSGVVAYKSGALTTITSYQHGLSTTSATFGSAGTYSSMGSLSLGSSLDLCLPLPEIRLNVTTNTTVYIVTRSSFTLGTLSVYGNLRARRVR